MEKIYPKAEIPGSFLSWEPIDKIVWNYIQNLKLACHAESLCAISKALLNGQSTYHSDDNLQACETFEVL